MPAITMDALKKIANTEVKGVSIDSPKSVSFGEDASNTWKAFNVFGSVKHPLLFIKNVILAEYYLCKRILWADVIIWQWDTRIYLPHFWFLKFICKPILVEWVGGDIRIPEIVYKSNRYYKKAIDDKTYSYPNESTARSLWIQKKFKFLKAIPFLCPEMSLFLDRKLFPFYFPTFQRINVSEYQPVYPDTHNQKVKLVHTPSSTGAKGTNYVRSAVENLKNKYNLEYLEITNKTHEEALIAIQNADIFIDQFIGGSYGMATCEAMALGKPVICYLMDPFVEILPKECPIVNTSADELENRLILYLTNPQLRQETGIQSRKYVEKYHDANKLAVELHNFLEKLLNNKKQMG